ncbi:MAG: hypothetical protein A2622_02115 [Bdellovibrionales bacterium RIFCSPHIGHO2_01_FULL_40_29]|nr:MAG: hypothetical protein A2622_02115 [Bdellovibrionales bacterium RIFCSPHIGHO2_01_FULL_40_29]OFZ33883.1 MAG: hypothetical protein A3D17_02535 [Bdellovibrionales bacterium RIFCSPHIGHO2_02_FULL_40_15]
MKNIFLFIVALFLVKNSLASISAEELLRASDQGRGGIKSGIEWVTEIETIENGEKSNRKFKVKTLDHDAYVEAIAPAKNKGEVYIFNDRNMWFYKPSLKKPVSISARQKLSGQAANGDIASTHYARDYSAVLEKEDSFNGQKCFVLLLKAKTKNLTYDQIRYWINAKSRLAVKAEFLTLQGKPFKVGTLEYANKFKLDGQVIAFVSSLTIADAKFPENKSIIKYSVPKAADHSAALFNVNNLTR